MKPLEIVRLRKRLGNGNKPVSQEKLARLIGVSHQSVRRWESQHNQPSLMARDRLRRLQEELDGKARIARARKRVRQSV